MRKKTVLKSLLSATMAMSVMLSTFGSSFALAAGSEKVSFNITADKICKSYSNHLPESLDKDLSGKLIIISTNDIHGAVNDLTYVSQLRNNLEKKHAKVLIVDSGDFSTDKDKVDNYKGEKSKDAKFCATKTEGIAPVKIMNAVRYNYACLGNHEFEKGEADVNEILKEAKFNIVDANIESPDNSYKFTPHITESIEGLDLKIGFFGLDSLENYKWYPDFGFEVKKDEAKLHTDAKTQVEALKDDGADIIIGLTHLGVDDDPGRWAANDPEKVKKAIKPVVDAKHKKEVNEYDYLYQEGIRSVDLFADVDDIDLLLDGHSHTTMTGSQFFDNVKVQSNGIWLRNIGVVVIDKDDSGEYAIEDRFLIPEKYYSEIGEDPKITNYIKYVTTASQNIKSAKEAREKIENYDSSKDYSTTDNSGRRGSSKSSSKAKRDFIDEAEDSSSIEASLPENEIDATEAASSASIEATDAAGTTASEDIANAEASSTEASSDEASTEKSSDNSGNTGDNHREHHRHRNYRQGFGG